MSDGISEEDVFVRLNLNFQAISILQNELVSDAWNLIVDILPEKDFDLNSVEVSGGLKKIHYWITQIVNGSLIFSASNKWAVNTFLKKNTRIAVNNNLILLPGLLSDEILARVIHSKLVALGGGCLLIGPVEVAKEGGNGISVFFTGDTYSLPSMKEWIGERSFFPESWWQRDDSSTLDVAPTAQDDLTIKPEYAESLDFLIKKPRLRTRKAELIRHNFNPKVLNGGGS